ncbi:MAG TPA: response regulator [Nitrospirota bacterium]|nr:response regulator [Nitrospirota bacterium]
MKTILLVDDDRDILNYLELTLKSGGYKIISETDALSALCTIQKGINIDLVITDYSMPGMDGHEFFNEVTKVLPSVPVIMLTGHVSVENYLKSLSLGLYEYVSKPIDSTLLHRIVKSALDSSEAQ